MNPMLCFRLEVGRGPFNEGVFKLRAETCQRCIDYVAVVAGAGGRFFLSARMADNPWRIRECLKAPVGLL